MPLREVSEALRLLHSALVRRTQADYERTHGRIAGAGQLLNLLMKDPFFAWMHPLSELMADVDHFAKNSAVESGVAAAIRKEVEQVLAAKEPGPFADRYRDELQDASVAGAHSQVKRLLEALPDVPATTAAEELHTAHHWNELRRLRLEK